MKNIFLALAVILLTNFSYGQKKESSEYSEKYESAGGGFINSTGRSKGDMKGSPYINENFTDANVDGMDKKARYNAFKDEMEYWDNGIGVTFYGKLNESSVSFKNPAKKYVYLNYKDGKTFVTGYLIELEKGDKASVYKREKITFIPGITPKTSYDRPTPNEYRKASDSYYFSINNGAIDKLPNKKNFAKLFGSNEKAVNDYMKDNNISMNDDKDLIKLFKFVNTL